MSEEGLRRRLAFVAGLALALGGCGAVSEARDSTTPEVMAGERMTPTPDAASRGWSGKSFVLRPDGLTVASDDPRDRPAALSFGTGEGAAIAALVPLIGEPRIARNVPCADGAATVAAFGPVTLIFAEGGFAGYRIAPEHGMRLSGDAPLLAGRTCSKSATAR